MKRICVLTTTRAEYGLLSPLIKRLIGEQEFDVKVVVTGMHLSMEFGLTWREIEQDGVCIDRKIEMLLSADTPAAISKSMGVALIGFADYFEETSPDALLVLGDRYEVLAVCIAAMNMRVPILHIHGGEITEGAVDDAIRHCITKLSYLHFASTKEYRDRIIQMGEEPSRVFNVGALGVENALYAKKLTKEELEESIGWKLENQYAVLTFHPTTLEDNTSEKQVEELLKAIEQFPDIQFLATKANADVGGRIINSCLEEYAATHKHLRCYTSLGMKRYLSALKYAKFVIGNSSSGLLEAPIFGIPTVNIGNRQKGRIRGKSVLDCKPERDSIIETIQSALLMDIEKIENPYGCGETSAEIIRIIKKEFKTNHSIVKKFYDIS